MPTLSPVLRAALQAAVAARFGQPIHYPSQCDALEIELRTNGLSEGRRLSGSTLRRFFGLVPKQGGYHLHTLDTLARYAGYPDFATFGPQAAAGPAHRPAPAPTPDDVAELLGMACLSHPERRLLGYFLGRFTRPLRPGQPAAPLALRLAAHPIGQKFFVESFVDLAHLNGSYGQVLAEYLRHKRTAEAQLFGHCALFLGEFLADDETAWRRRLQHVRSLPVPAATPAFPRGRRAFAEIVAAWHDAPDRRVPAALLARLRHEAPAMPRAAAALLPALLPPTFYNDFPAGYHFLVAEALFFTSQYEALRGWLELTYGTFAELGKLEQNVYNELLRAFYQVAVQRTGALASPCIAAAQFSFPAETHTWLLDYFQVHIALISLHQAIGNSAPAPEISSLNSKVLAFADAHKMPFFGRMATALTT